MPSQILAVKKVHYIWFFIIALSTNPDLFAQTVEQDQDQEKEDTIARKKKGIQKLIGYFKEAKKDKSTEKFDISFIGGPNYSEDTKLGIGLLASGLYRMDKKDSLLAPSDVSIYSNFTTSGFFSVGIENHTIFPNDMQRLNLDMSYAYLPTQFYGIGYKAGKEGNYSDYDQNEIKISTNFLQQIFTNTYVGINLKLHDIQSKNFDIAEFEPQEELNSFIFGGGFSLNYDTRDFNPNPSKGLYIKLEENFYPHFLGNKRSFSEFFFTIRTYQKLWTDAILAYDFNAILKSGNVPWNMLSLLGGSRQMRGYYKGRYRNKKQLNTQVELRQKIYNRHGAVLWLGTGKVFKNFNDFSFDHFLPNYGIGYRWEFKNRVNVRLDYGISKGGSGFYFNINEAF